MAKNTTPTAAQEDEARAYLAMEIATWEAHERNHWAAIEARMRKQRAAAAEEAEFAYWAEQQEMREALPW
jgi:hypothetical protein